MSDNLYYVNLLASRGARPLRIFQDCRFERSTRCFLGRDPVSSRFDDGQLQLCRLLTNRVGDHGGRAVPRSGRQRENSLQSTRGLNLLPKRTIIVVPLQLRRQRLR
jgi:hypothetical protein